ncbi:NIPSNAP family protein [Planctomycetes bacterium K23_9]|uniref:NIPSNAP domain-containing protein n=1 Tax=Stieleria marina TaxID=1930275 RepID=A0A517NQH5_9BACT|nr:hypothetical protein K239x_13170 [Planctomycetes bacterium K23_9]
MKIVCCCVLASIACVLTPALRAEETDSNHQYYEVRSYVLGDKGDEKAVDQYLSQALLPALQRAGIGPVGVLGNAENDKSGSHRVVVVIPLKSPNDLTAIRDQVCQSADYLAAAAKFESGGKSDAPYQRVTSELLVAMDCWPKVVVDQASLQNDERVYELRLYESPNARLGNLKVDMFNNGEVPIFLDCGIKPVFIGQSILGPQTPNLTYLTVYPDDGARKKAWGAFRAHPDWKVLSKVAKYAGTVSKIDTYIMVAKPYSQM